MTEELLMVILNIKATSEYRFRKVHLSHVKKSRHSRTTSLIIRVLAEVLIRFLEMYLWLMVILQGIW